MAAGVTSSNSKPAAASAGFSEAVSAGFCATSSTRCAPPTITGAASVLFWGMASRSGTICARNAPNPACAAFTFTTNSFCPAFRLTTLCEATSAPLNTVSCAFCATFERTTTFNGITWPMLARVGASTRSIAASGPSTPGSVTTSSRAPVAFASRAALWASPAVWRPSLSSTRRRAVSLGNTLSPRRMADSMFVPPERICTPGSATSRMAESERSTCASSPNTMTAV